MDNEAIKNLCMQGKVTEVVGSRARVVFEDRDNMVSAPLAILQMYVGGNKSIFVPEVGEEVVCLFLPIGLEAGYIIGSVYTDGNEPPADNNAIQFNDGSSIDFKDGILNITTTAAINLTAPRIALNGAVIGGNGTVTQFKGGINTDQDVVASGVSLQNHTNGGQGVDR